MASKICDTEPCDKLKAALKVHFSVEPNYDPEHGLIFIHLLRKNPPSTIDKMYLRYCPFCGTRMALGLVDGLELLIPSSSPRRAPRL